MLTRTEKLQVMHGQSTLEIGVSSAVISFNNGAAEMLMFDSLDIKYMENSQHHSSVSKG